MGTVVGERLPASLSMRQSIGASRPLAAFWRYRMQEGIAWSLMQVAKTSSCCATSFKGWSFYLTVLTDPTTGGVTASFAMKVISWQKAQSFGEAFAGRRLLSRLYGKIARWLSKTRVLLEHGFVDAIVKRGGAGSDCYSFELSWWPMTKISQIIKRRVISPVWRLWRFASIFDDFVELHGIVVFVMMVLSLAVSEH